MKRPKRKERPRLAKLRSHLLILLLASAIWLAISQSDKVNPKVDNVASIDVVLQLGAESGEWVIASDFPRSGIQLALSGPRKEVSDYRERLGARQGGTIFRAEITAEMLKEASEIMEQKRKIIRLRLDDFKIDSADEPQAEVSVAFSDPKRIIEVALERVDKQAATLVRGDVKERLGFNSHLTFKDTYTLRGPFSKLVAAPHEKSGSIRLELQDIDLTTIEDTNLTHNLRLPVALPKGLSVLDADGKPSNELEVNVGVRFERIGEYTERVVTKNWDILLPRWLIEKHVEIPTIALPPIDVRLDLDAGSAKYFTAENVRAVIDLSDLTESDLTPAATTSEDGKKLSADVSDVFVRIILPRDIDINYRMPSGFEKATLERYVEVLGGVKLVWEKE